jgi:chemotaxis protein methyltransferase CheR
MNAVLQDSTFRQLRDFIYEKSGIFIPDTKKYLLENRLSKRIEEKNLNGFEDYLYILRYGNNDSEISTTRSQPMRPFSSGSLSSLKFWSIM